MFDNWKKQIELAREIKEKYPDFNPWKQFLIGVFIAVAILIIPMLFLLMHSAKHHNVFDILF